MHIIYHSAIELKPENGIYTANGVNIVESRVLPLGKVDDHWLYKINIPDSSWLSDMATVRALTSRKSPEL